MATLLFTTSRTHTSGRNVARRLILTRNAQAGQSTCQTLPPLSGGKKRRRNYNKLPPKIAETNPWRMVSVDLIGPYTLQGKDISIWTLYVLQS